MESSIQRTLADDGTATVTVHGEIDFANCDELATAYAKPFASGPHPPCGSISPRLTSSTPPGSAL
jgi:hypothetical protein